MVGKEFLTVVSTRLTSVSGQTFALIKIALLVAGCALGAGDKLDAQAADKLRNSNANRVRLKTTLSAEMAERFSDGQAISVKVPPGRDAISSLIVKNANTYKNDPIAISPKLSVEGSVVLVEFPKSQIQRLDYQPLRIRIYESGITRIELKPVDENESDANLAKILPRPLAKSAMPAEFFFRLKQNRGIPVRQLDNTGFRITNEVFDHQVPFSVISGIYFDDNDQRQVTLLLDNGDTISGKHHWPVILSVETNWGTEEISLEDIASVTRNAASKIIESGVSNPRLIVTEK